MAEKTTFRKNYFIFVLLSFVFLLDQIHAKKQAHYGITSYCVNNSLNDIQFGSRGDSSYGTFSMSDNSTYKLGLNCTVELRAPQGYKLHLAFSEIDTRSCDLDHILVTPGNKNGTTLCGHRNCPAENCADLQFDGSNITVRFTTSINGTVSNMKGFIGMVTVFSTADSHGNCYSKDQFRCRNRHCIWNGLFCNKHNHCGDDSDEPSGCKPFASQTIIGVVAVLLGIISFVIFVPLFCIVAIKGQRRKIKVMRSTYQPIPTSINEGDSQQYNATLIRDENMPSYQFYVNSATSSQESTPIFPTLPVKKSPYQIV